LAIVGLVYSIRLRFRLRKRWSERMHRCLECEYDLRGTVDAGNDVCPECGAVIGTLLRGESSRL